MTIRLDDAADAADVARIVVLRLHDGTVRSEDQEITVDGAEVSFTLTDLRAGEGLLVQIADTAGNLTTYTGKSTIPSVLPIEASGPPVAGDGQPVTLRLVVPDYTGQGERGEIVEPVWYAWDFGAPVGFQGSTVDRASGLITAGTTDGVDIRFEDADGDGTRDAVVDLTVTYGPDSPDPITATARVVDSDGGIGVDDHVMSFGCDPADVPDHSDADVIGCGLDLDATTSTGEASSTTTGSAGRSTPR